MAAFDKDNQPLADAEALEHHIKKALSIPEPRGIDITLTYQMIKRIFKPEIVGAENIPDTPCLFVGNHSLFALDGAVLLPIFIQRLNRFPRSMGDRFLFSNRRVSDILMRSGGVMGHPTVCQALMEDKQDLLVFPGGAHEAVKPASQLYELQWKERYGFVKLAAEYGYTIMPFGLVGPDEFYGHLMEGQDLPDSALGKLLTHLGLLNENIRSDILPPIPIGSFGTIFPKPQPCFLGFGQPVDLSRHRGKKRLAKKTLHSIRAEVAAEIEEQIAELLEIREQNKGDNGLLRRLMML